MSLDGRIDDSSERRLILSQEADLDRVDEVRAGCDAIMVGAGTVRRDNPRLVVRAEHRRLARIAAGLPPTPTKVTVTAGRGVLDPTARFFTTDPSAVRLVYCPPAAADRLRAHLGPAAEVVAVGAAGVGAAGVGAAGVGGVPARVGDAEGGGARARAGNVGARGVVDETRLLDPRALLADLTGRGVRRLLVEGGTAVHTMFLAGGLVDELHLVIAPFLIGDADAPRFVGPGAYPNDAARPFALAEARPIGDAVLLRYLRNPEPSPS
jgi:5-amino-6-(5-phosphoribosylamino)uracil reductase